MDLFTLVASLNLDTSNYDQKVAEAITAAKNAGSEIDGALGGGAGVSGLDTPARSASVFGSTVKAILTSGVIENAGQLLVEMGKKGIKMASDLQEVQNVVDNVFLEQKDAVNEWSKNTMAAYGLTELQAKNYASNIGAIFSGMDVDPDNIAEMSMRVAELTGDLASFYNLDHDTAYQKLVSGLIGEAEPLRALGIDVSATNLGTVYAGFDKMSAAEKAAARYEYILNQTAIAQGDFFRTSEGYANASRTFENYMDMTAAKLGESVLPILNAGANAANLFFAALYETSPEESIANIDRALRDTVADTEIAAFNANAMVDVLEKYGERASLTAEEQIGWDTVAKELIRTIPELNSLINVQTGEIEGGTSALRENISAWEEAGKISAETSALAAKQDMLADINRSIAEEQAQIAIAEQKLENASNKAIELGQTVAQAIGKDFDGTLEGVRSLLDTNAGWYAAEAAGYTLADINEIFGPINEAAEVLAGHQETLASLQSEYDTVSQAIETSNTAIDTSLQELGTTFSETVTEFEEENVELAETFDQSEAAKANALATASAATAGLEEGYPAFSAAAQKYSVGLSGVGGAYVPRSRDVPQYAVGIDYVPSNNYLAYLHRGEAVLTREENEDRKSSKTARGNVTVNQYIYAQEQTAADLMQEAMWQQERAVLYGV